MNLRMTIPAVAFMILAIFFSGCGKIIYDALLPEDPKVASYSNSQTGKEIVFVGMVHIGYPEYYDSVSSILEDLESRNFIILYEFAQSNLKDSVKKDLLKRKIRKISGMQPSRISNKVDTANHLIFGEIPYPEDVEIIEQPFYTELGVDTSKAIRADVPLETIVAAYESKYGEITLTNCDLKTQFKGDYECDKLNKKDRSRFHKEFIANYRDSVVISHINTIAANKIAVIYGAAHLKSFEQNLFEHDTDWKKEKINVSRL